MGNGWRVDSCWVRDLGGVVGEEDECGSTADVEEAGRGVRAAVLDGALAAPADAGATMRTRLGVRLRPTVGSVIAQKEG